MGDIRVSPFLFLIVYHELGELESRRTTMLRDDKTFEEFQYHINDISNMSSKLIYVECDYCGTLLSKTKKNRTKSNSILDKDACNQCGRQKREELCFKKHGVKNYAQIDSVKEKIKNSKNTIDYDIATSKFKITMNERYGVDNPMHSEVLSNKQKNTLKENYGVTNPSQNLKIKEKIKQSLFDRYGETSFLKTEECKKRFLEKYGVDNPSKLSDHTEKRKESCLKKYGAEHFLKVKENADKHGKDVLKSKIENGLIKLYDGRPISEYRDEAGYSDSHFRTLIKEHGFDIAKRMTPHVSSLEQKIIELYPNFKRGQIIENYRPDFVYNNLVIELDGLYWHSDKICTDNSYHFKKRITYEKNGYKSLFFREDEIKNKLDVVCSIINNKLGISNRIFARKTKISTCPPDFFSINHLMGKGFGQIYALEYEGQTVAAFQVKRIKDNNWELSRFACKLSYNIVGGFSKLFQAFLKDKNPDSFLTFIDMRYGNGNYLPNLGFKEKTCYPSFKWTDTKNTYARTQFPSNSGYEKGLYKIWDCGQKKFVWEKGV